MKLVTLISNRFYFYDKQAHMWNPLSSTFSMIFYGQDETKYMQYIHWRFCLDLRQTDVNFKSDSENWNDYSS